MKRIIIGILVIFCFYSSVYAGNDEDYIMGDIETLPADFYLNVSLVGSEGNFVDKLCVFDIRRADGSSNTGVYDISFFRNGNFIRMYPGQTLPFSFKRNYRGIADGEYKVTFVAKDEAGKIGKGIAVIRVRH